MPRQIEFSVDYASSEEERHSSLELNVHGPTVRGWQSAKKCLYPQQLILRLRNSARLTKVQVLAHQYLIPQKLEIWTSMDNKSNIYSNFDYLGYINLSDNASSMYKSRELKSVSLPVTEASFIKLKLHKPHANAHNIYEQVALIAINMIGEYAQPQNDHLGFVNASYVSPYDDLAFEMYVDREVAKIIRKMELKKLKAVEEERFEYASKLKIAMESLRQAGERLGKYELEKKYAIALEDYDKAKAKKAQAEDFREQVYQSLRVQDLLELNGPLASNDATSMESVEHLEAVDGAIGGSVSPTELAAPIQRPVSPLRLKAQSPGPESAQSPTPLHSTHERQCNGRTSSLRRKTKSAGPVLRSSFEAYEERMIPALRHSHTNEFTRECHNDTVTESKIPSRLNEREKKQAALPITVFGMDMVEKFYAKQFTDKEEGLAQLKEELANLEPANSKPSANKVARAAVLLLHRALRDKVFSVYSAAAQLIRVFFVELAAERVSPAEVARSVERLLPELLAKSGDTTPRVHNMAVHTILSMADCKCVRDLHIIPVHLSRPISASAHQRLALSRLEMVEQLILNHGISTDKQSGLTCRTLAELGSTGLHHPAEAVRKVSERILVLVYRVNPRLVRKQLPPDDDVTRRNLLYRQLFHEFDLIDHQRKADLELKAKSPPPRASPSTSSSGSCASVVAVVHQENGLQETKQDKMCIFCLSKSQSYSEEGLNTHYWRNCPMLTRCEACKQVLEISYLNAHLLSECDFRSNYFKCPICKQTVLEKSTQEHRTEDKCSKPVDGFDRCPLCRNLVNKNKWREHLMGEYPCPKNPRSQILKTCTKSRSNPQNLSDKLTSPTGRDY